MGGVYCPTCEAGVEPTAKFCLSCGHDLTIQGPITATGHDLNELRQVIRMRQDLSMAEKFDMIAKIEDGGNPITLGIAAAGDEAEGGAPVEETKTKPANVAPALVKATWGHKAAHAAIEKATKGTKLGDLNASGAFKKEEKVFSEAMDIGRRATLHLLEVAYGAVLPESDELQAIPIMQPPNKSFCPKCGSDIQSHALLQWKKWSDMSTDGLVIQLEAAMKAALLHASASYKDQLQDLKEQLAEAKKRAEAQPIQESAPARETPVKEAPAKKVETKESQSEPTTKSSGKDSAVSTPAKSQPTIEATKPKAGGLFGAKKAKKSYDGPPEGKAEWFLEEALDTVYDPHGTGKTISAAMIVARSADGNVRVRDIVRAYAEFGEEGITELAWTSPLTKYIIEAYDAC